VVSQQQTQTQKVRQDTSSDQQSSKV